AGGPVDRLCAKIAAIRQVTRAQGVELFINARTDVYLRGLVPAPERLGARAIATTSAGVAWSHGYPDGDVLPPAIAIATAAAVVRAVQVPVTCDFEGGYSDDPDAVGGLAAQLVDAGVVGINLEDGSGPVDRLCAKIAAIRRATRAQGVELFINARTDVYLRGLVPPPERLAESLARTARYRDAGASGIFVPGVAEPSAIEQIAREAQLPLNVLAMAGLPSPAELTRLGARRLSAGSGITQAIWGRAASLATAFLRDGTGTVSPDGAMSYGEINALLAAR
ncbi:MAG: isocitrate lyase/phosphoenolpyruvate mutase family protein, partial [Kofleriaceae bacterium]